MHLNMGSPLTLSKMKNIDDALEHTLPFLDPVDGNALSEAVMGPKPDFGRLPIFFKHDELWHIWRDGKIIKIHPTDPLHI